MNTISDDHVRIVVEAIVIIIVKVPSGHPPFPCYRPTLRDALLKDPHFSPVPEGKPESLNRTIDLALRLWLVLYIRDGFAHAAKSIEWNDTISLQELIAGQFRKPRLLSALSEKMFDIALPDHFNAMSLRRYSGVKVKLTSSLNEHLDLDRERNKLKIFPLKYYLYGLRRRSETPLMEVGYRLTCLNLLFPSRDTKTQKYLKKKGYTFGMEGPVSYSAPLYLSDFHFWRDRLSNLYTEFCSPPPSMTQLFNDRRNVLQWYTFWFAVVILALTTIFGMIQSTTACLSTRYSYEALQLARAEASARACPIIT
ncbi:hypothetical protein BJ875DRAFT_380632 [Amylocarpus encephaloides]|uniref:Uncharacterized protein n=1 Tax=Amylocarpus encephaloides TaxID=45428 RepID=A0A9P7YF21_9HELO|nr:hypothetical protein BJ875DRAFT_380632 [Amylocarpus encephaloides]